MRRLIKSIIDIFSEVKVSTDIVIRWESFLHVLIMYAVTDIWFWWIMKARQGNMNLKKSRLFFNDIRLFNQLLLLSQKIKVWQGLKEYFLSSAVKALWVNRNMELMNTDFMSMPSR